MQLVAEWAATLPATWKSKTHVNVGAQHLMYQGVPLTPRQSAAFGVWNSWADLRVFTGSEVWIVEAKIVATGCAYGELLDYLQEYPQSVDYQQFKPAPIVGVVLAAALRGATARYFSTLGIRSIEFTPSFSLGDALAKIFPAAQVLQSGEAPGEISAAAPSSTSSSTTTNG